MCFLWEICELKLICTEFVRGRAVLRFICPSGINSASSEGDDGPIFAEMEESSQNVDTTRCCGCDSGTLDRFS